MAAGARPLLVATRNPGKLAELRDPLAHLGFRVVDLTEAGVPLTPEEDAVEVYDTFEDNALAKARYYSAASGGRATVADDSGLMVDALGGEPGVRSKRWSGIEGTDAEVTAANNSKLLRVLEGAGARGARFVCAVAYVSGFPEEPIVVRGETLGRIAPAPRGASGFGYDPLFESAELGWRTFGEAAAAEKRRVSHRGRALAALYERLAARRDAAG